MPKYQKRKDGRFQAKVWDGTFENGKKHYKYLFSTKSSRDLELKVIEYEANRLNGYVAADKKTDLYDYIARFIELTKAMQRDSTKRAYSMTLNRLESFKGLTFDNVSYTLIQNIINENKEHPHTCHMIKLLIGQSFKSAEQDKLLARGTTEDILKMLKKPKINDFKKRAITDEEKEKIRNCNLPLADKAFLYILYFTGARRSEVLALTKDDITDYSIRINKTLSLATQNNRFCVKSPKTKRGNRSVPIPHDLKVVLDEYIPTLQGDLLFPYNGGYYTPKGYESMWKRIKKRVGIDFSAHYLRHNYCTMLCYQSIQERNISTKKIAELLGDTEQMILNVYSHIIEEKENVTEAIENALKF